MTYSPLTGRFLSPLRCLALSLALYPSLIACTWFNPAAPDAAIPDGYVWEYDYAYPYEGGGPYDFDGGGYDPDGGEVADATIDSPPIELQPTIMVNGDTTTTHGYATITPGSSLTFSAVVDCPTGITCTYAWDFGNGETATGVTPAAVTYANAGQYHVTLAVSADGKLAGSVDSYISAWAGTFTDDFNRAQLDLAQHYWLAALDPLAIWSIQSNWAHVTHDLEIPGSSALMASIQVKNLHVEVTQRRAAVLFPGGTDEQNTHYSDVIVRMDPGNKKGRFYRIRFMEGWSGGDPDDYHSIQIAIFKIIDGNDQHGILLNDRTQRPSQPPYPTDANDVPVLGDFDPDRNLDFRIIIDVTTDGTTGGPRFNVKVVDAANPSQLILAENWTDGLGVPDEVGPTSDPLASTPITGAGLVGITQFSGETYFDDFTLQALP